MNIISLKYFVELAKELHVTNTAQKLYISQQNLTQHLKRLEDHYGVILFNRKPKLSLTYAGEILYKSALKIVNEEIFLMNKFTDISEKSIGKLRLGILSYRAQICLPLIMEQFYQKWPNVTIETIDQNSEKLEHMLFSNEIDIFIGIVPKDNPKLNVIPLLSDKIYIIANDSLLEKHFGSLYTNLKNKYRNGVDLKEFSKVPFLLPKSPSKIRSSIDYCLRIDNIKPEIFLETMTTDLLLPLYPYGYGIFFCTHMRLDLLKNMFQNINAFPLISNNKFVSHQLALAYHKNQTMYSYISDFINITQNVFEYIEKSKF